MIQATRTRALSVVLLVSAGAALAMPFTGDATADFSLLPYVEVIDGPPPIDVGIPNAPANVVSGWDMERLLFNYDADAGELAVGMDFAVICGDADGDGGEGVTAPWLADNFGVDLPMLSMTESVCIAFDFDQDGFFDLIAGVGIDDGIYRVSQFSGSPLLPSAAFGPLLPQYDGGHFYTPAALSPDFELSLSGADELLVFEQGSACFDFLFFAGSYQDDGIGEDFKSGTVCFEGGVVDAVVAPTTFGLGAAYPNPFNPTTTLRYTLPETGAATLTVHDLQGRLVSTLIDGLQPAGEGQATFDAAGLASGLYFATLTQGPFVSTTRLLLAK